MTKSFMPPIQSDDELREIQFQGLQWTLRHAYTNSEFYQKRFDAAGIKVEDVRCLDDIVHLPFTTNHDLQDDYPFPLRAVSFEKIVRIHASSGTAGKRKVLCYTQKDIDDWATMFARCYELAGLTREDRVQIAVGYGMWTAGIGFQLGCERFGAMAVPLGPGNLDLQLQIMVDLQTTVFGCTASMGLLMADEIARHNLRKKIALRKIIMGSERHSEAMDKRIRELTGIEDLFDIPGMTELYGPGTGLDCVKHEGIHYWADYYILEIIDPQTLQPVRPGELGEMVITTIKKEGAPLIRYRTHDLTRIIPRQCSCGNIFPMHEKIFGRSDDMVTFRGVNIYPSQIDYILSRIKGVGSEYQVILDRGSDGKDYMTLKVERQHDVESSLDKDTSQIIEKEIKNQIMVSVKTEVIEYGSLPRTERKSKRIFDNRE